MVGVEHKPGGRSRFRSVRNSIDNITNYGVTDIRRKSIEYPSAIRSVFEGWATQKQTELSNNSYSND